MQKKTINKGIESFDQQRKMIYVKFINAVNDKVRDNTYRFGDIGGGYKESTLGIATIDSEEASDVLNKKFKNVRF